MALNITTAVIGSGCNAATASPSLAQWDKGQILQISGVELPETYKVEFSNGDMLEAIPAIGTAEGVEIPDKLLYSSSPIRAYIVLSEAEGERNTEYWVTIYVKPREIPEDIEPDPAQQDVIDDLIAQLNTGVGKAEAAADEAEASAQDAEAASQAVQDLGVEAETLAPGAPAAVQKIVDAETGAVTLRFGLPRGADGASPVVTVTTITGGHRVTVTDAAGAHTFDVMDGRSVTDVTMGADYKLTFTFSDGTTWTTPTSIRGETGATPRFTIGTVSTLDPDQSATASITGTPEDPVLNLGIPKGQAGATDAGGVTYDPTESYQSGTAGAALNDLSRQLSDLTDTVSTTQIINSASGAIASFDDGADALPIRKLVANIEPVQDLHGYDSPWPAGGGTNKYNTDTKTVGQALNVANGGSYNNVNWEMSDYIPATQGNLTLSWESDTNFYQANICAYDVNKDFIAESGVAFSGYTFSHTFAAPAGTAFVRFSWSKLVSGSEYQRTNVRVNIGSADLGYSPYSNICPISGHTGAEIQQTGKNLVDVNSDENTRAYIDTAGVIHSSATWTTCGLVRVSGGVPYVLSGLTSHPNSGIDNYRTFDKYKNYIGVVVKSAETYPVTFSQDVAYVQFCWKDTDDDKVMFEQSATSSDYATYQSNQISVTFPSEAGTVYGGTLTVNPDRTGQLVVDRASFNWTSGGYLTSRGAWAINKADVVTINAGNQTTLKGTVCDKLPSETWAQISNDANASSAGCVFGNGLAFRIAGFTTAEEYIAFLADNPLQFAYLLKEPITYQLTSEQISDILNTLYGTNNIWADTGDTEVTYPADTKLYIDGKIAEAIAALNS